MHISSAMLNKITWHKIIFFWQLHLYKSNDGNRALLSDSWLASDRNRIFPFESTVCCNYSNLTVYAFASLRRIMHFHFLSHFRIRAKWVPCPIWRWSANWIWFVIRSLPSPTANYIIIWCNWIFHCRYSACVCSFATFFLHFHTIGTK